MSANEAILPNAIAQPIGDSNMAIYKINAGSSEHVIRELWIGDSAEELQTEGDKMISRYHPEGYGTRVTASQPCESMLQVRHYAGKFFCNFSRDTSCD